MRRNRTVGKKRRRRKKKRNVIVRRVSSFIQIHDPEHLYSVGVVFGAIIVAIAWLTEGWDEAVRYFKIVFFIGLGVSAGLHISGLIYDAVKGVVNRKDLFHAVVLLAVIGISLIAMEDHVELSIKACIGGVAFAAFIFLFTVVFSSVSSWFRR